MIGLFGALIGIVAAGGFGLAVAGLVAVPTVERHRAAEHADLVKRGGSVVGAVVVGLLLTGWPAVGALFGAVVFVTPSVLDARRHRRRSLARTEGLAGWAEMLRDTIASHAGLREAIAVTAEVAPEAIRPEVRRLSTRAERESLSVGLARFAEEVADPVADLIVAALGVAADGQARNVPALLGGIATAARAEAQMRVRVETGRARTYSSSRALMVVTATLSTGLMLFAPEFMAPFASFVGQLVLMVVAGLFAGALWGLVALGRAEEPPRILAGVTEAWQEAGR